MIKYPTIKKPAPPKVGQTMDVHGAPCRIVKVRPFGTVDVESLDGKRAWRVTGLWF